MATMWPLTRTFSSSSSSFSPAVVPFSLPLGLHGNGTSDFSFLFSSGAEGGVVQDPVVTSMAPTVTPLLSEAAMVEQPFSQLPLFEGGSFSNPPPTVYGSDVVFDTNSMFPALFEYGCEFEVPSAEPVPTVSSSLSSPLPSSSSSSSSRIQQQQRRNSNLSHVVRSVGMTPSLNNGPAAAASTMPCGPIGDTQEVFNMMHSNAVPAQGVSPAAIGGGAMDAPAEEEQRPVKDVEEEEEEEEVLGGLAPCPITVASASHVVPSSVPATPLFALEQDEGSSSHGSNSDVDMVDEDDDDDYVPSPPGAASSPSAASSSKKSKAPHPHPHHGSHNVHAMLGARHVASPAVKKQPRTSRPVVGEVSKMKMDASFNDNISQRKADILFRIRNLGSASYTRQEVIDQLYGVLRDHTVHIVDMIIATGQDMRDDQWTASKSAFGQRCSRLQGSLYAGANGLWAIDQLRRNVAVPISYKLASEILDCAKPPSHRPSASDPYDGLYQLVHHRTPTAEEIKRAWHAALPHKMIVEFQGVAKFLTGNLKKAC